MSVAKNAAIIGVVEMGPCKSESLCDFRADCERVGERIRQESTCNCGDELDLDPSNVVRLAQQIVSPEWAPHVALALCGHIRMHRAA